MTDTSPFIPPPAVDLAFPHSWQATVLADRPLILPSRHFVYPREVEEVERGALEVFVRPAASAQQPSPPSPDGQPFLATCALGFRDPAVPTGIWSCPNRDELCAIAGGYAYIIHTIAPERFMMIPYRPVFAVRAILSHNLILFVGSRTILAWGTDGNAWESGKLSDEGITVAGVENDSLRGLGWQMMADKEVPFVVDLRTGQTLAT